MNIFDKVFNLNTHKDINIFWHICGINNWSSIVEDQLSFLKQTQLFDITNKIYISYIGESIKDIEFLLNDTHKKNELVSYTNNYKEYERPCLHSMLEWSQYNDSYVLYMHCKGVSYPNNKHVWLWRKMLEHILFDNKDICLNKLKEYDVIGVNLIDSGNKDQILIENHRMHFSGNFWWSKTDYIKTLPKIVPHIKNLINKKYWLCERWICYHYPQAKLYEIASTKIKHFYHDDPPPVSKIKINI